jgi:hypothetical protein
MESTFSISLICEVKDRPPISHKVRDYLVQFITEEVLIPEKIILSAGWDIELAMMFMPRDESGPEQVDVFEPDVFDDIRLKAYPVVIPLDAINQAEDPYLKTIGLMYEGLFLFFTSFYKNITPHLMEGLWVKINFDYLFSLPYPAEITEQQYIGD